MKTKQNKSQLLKLLYFYYIDSYRVKKQHSDGTPDLKIQIKSNQIIHIWWCRKIHLKEKYKKQTNQK